MYWYGGTGSVSDHTNHWSNNSGNSPASPLGRVPNSGDDVVFDTNSASGNYTVTFGSYLAVHDVTWGLPSSGVPTWAGNFQLDIGGSLYCVATMARSFTGNLVFNSTSAGETITMNSVVLASTVTFNGVGGSWQLQDNFSVGTGKVITLTNGTLDTNDVTVTAQQFVTSGTATRALDLGTSQINVSTSFGFSSATGLTFTGDASTITFSGQSGTLLGAGQTFGVVQESSAFRDGFAITGANTFTDLTLLGIDSTSFRRNVTLGANQTVSGTFTVTGTHVWSRINVLSVTPGTQYTITAAVVSLTNVNFGDIVGAGVASPFTGTSIGNLQNCSGITFTTPVTRHWVGGTGLWSDAAGALWSDSDGGAGGQSMPICHDTVIFDAGSFSADGQTVTIDQYYPCTDISFADVDQAININFNSQDKNFLGDFVLKGTETVATPAVNIIFLGRATDCVIDTKGVSFTQQIYFNGYGGKYTLSSNFITSGTMYMGLGSFDANDFNVNVGVLNLTSSVVGATIVSMGNGTFTLTGTGDVVTTKHANLTLNIEGADVIINNASATAKTFNGGSFTWNDVTFTGAGTGTLTIVGNNTYSTLSILTAPKTVILSTSSIQTVSSLVTDGSAGNLTTINTTFAGFPATIAFLDTNGMLDYDYLSLKDITATIAGGALLFAGAHSTNTSGNSRNWRWINASPRGPNGQ